MGLILLFFVTALLYSTVGFGGGSTYNALLVLGLEEIALVPVVALSCNLVVVVIGTVNFRQHLPLPKIVPLVAASVPAAWLGGYISVPSWLFVGMLAIALSIAGLSLLLLRPQKSAAIMRDTGDRQPSRLADAASGGILGLIAGITGIGGGIYLAPLLYWRRWASPAAIAATCAFFILVNSLSGLAGQVMKLGQERALGAMAEYWPLLGAVMVGGLLGSRLGSRRLPSHWLRIGTGVLILYVAVRLGLRFPAEWSRL